MFACTKWVVVGVKRGRQILAILKIQPTKFSDRLEVWCESKREVGEGSLQRFLSEEVEGGSYH